MIKSKGWNWKIVDNNKDCVWLNPSIESYYLLDRWKNLNKKVFLDLGCGLGRHTIMFASNNFKTFAFDISEEAIKKTKEWAIKLGLNINYAVGDMLDMPYDDESIDVILGYNVISHTDTLGVKKIISQLKRILKKDGECYLTLCSKDTWGFKQENFPLVDENTRLRMDEGPEYGVAHFYADYELIKDLFCDFEIISIRHIQDFYENNGQEYSSYHYHILIRKNR